MTHDEAAKRATEIVRCWRAGEPMVKIFGEREGWIDRMTLMVNLLDHLAGAYYDRDEELKAERLEELAEDDDPVRRPI